VPAQGQAFRNGQVSSAGVTDHATRFLTELRSGAEGGHFDAITTPQWESTRVILDEVSADRVAQGFSLSEPATFVFSLKKALFELLGEEIGIDAARLRGEVWMATKLLDKLGLSTVQSYQNGREAIIAAKATSCWICRRRHPFVGVHSRPAGHRHAR
jgi:rsbT co-antagonist protein RsbR